MFNSNINNKSKIVITCLPGLSPYVVQELEQENFKVIETAVTSVTTEGNLDDTVHLNLILRSASKVLYGIRSVPCSTMDDLYNILKEIPWELYFTNESYFSIESTSNQEQVKNTMFLNQKAKDAVVDRFMKLYDSRPNSGPDKNFLLIHIRWHSDQLDVYIDTSGQTISKHNYRTNPYKAPLLEALASSVIMASKWDHGTPLVIPMCGSGTLAIEAVLMAIHSFPGTKRDNFSFMHLKEFNRDEFEKTNSKIRSRMVSDPILQVYASDISKEAIDISKENAKNAEVDHLIKFEVANFQNCFIPSQPGTIIFNPPYGDRLHELETIEDSYKDIGDFLKKECEGYTGYVFTANLGAAKSIGLRTSSKKQFFNGAKEARLLEFQMYKGSMKQTKD